MGEGIYNKCFPKGNISNIYHRFMKRTKSQKKKRKINRFKNK